MFDCLRAIIRAQFDKWFSSKVREAGALLICETTVNHLIMDGDQVDGVDQKTKEREIFANFRKTRKLTGLVGDAYKLWKAIR